MKLPPWCLGNATELQWETPEDDVPTTVNYCGLFKLVEMQEEQERFQKEDC